MISRQKLKQVCSWVFCVVAMCLAAASAYAQSKLFEILRGKNNPVCHAYLSALEYLAKMNSEFKYAPWCERNLNPSVEGFPLLERVYITDPEEAYTLRWRIFGFLGSKNQFYWEQGPYKDRSKTDRDKSVQWVMDTLRNRQLAMWWFRPPLDIDNDGRSDNVLHYRYGACDSSRPVSSLGLIVSPGTRAIDEKETVRLFGDPRPYPVKTDSFIQLRGGSTGVFRYGNRDYIDAWGTDEAWTKRERPPVTGIVYFRQNDKVSVVCEVRWNREKVQ